MTWLLPLVTLAFAGFSLVLSSFFAFRSLSRSASAEWVDQLEKRVAECERDRAELHRLVAELRDREIYLMRQVVKANGG